MLDWAILYNLAEKHLRIVAVIQNVPAYDLDDIRQSVFLKILLCRVRVAQMGKEEHDTFIDKCVERYAKRRKRYRLRNRSLEDELTPTVNEIRQGEIGELGYVAIRIDVSDILQSLTERQRDICRHLMDDKSPRRIQKILKCSQSTMTEEMTGLRQRFESSIL